MMYRKFGRTAWQVSEIGYGMWGMAGWTGSDDQETNAALDLSVEKGCTFFDTAWGYGAGESERILGRLVKRHPERKLYLATKIPPLNFKWPSKPHYKIEDCFPVKHIIEYTEKSLVNLGVEVIDLMQFHVWEDAWHHDERWQRAVEDLKAQGKIRAMGLSVNRWEPDNCLQTLKTGLIDSVQVIYNIFDQAPEDHLLPLCKELDIAVIARVPFDEGTLTGTFTLDTKFPDSDWRASYFVPENLKSSVAHADLLKPFIPDGMTMAEMALRFILCNDSIATTIPGMRKIQHVKSNLNASDGKKLDQHTYAALKHHRWDRLPTEWSQ